MSCYSCTNDLAPDHPMEGLSKILYDREKSLAYIRLSNNPLESIQEILSARRRAESPGSCMPSMPPITELDDLPESVKTSILKAKCQSKIELNLPEDVKVESLPLVVQNVIEWAQRHTKDASS